MKILKKEKLGPLMNERALKDHAMVVQLEEDKDSFDLHLINLVINIIIKMNRSVSRGQLSYQLEKSPSRRGIYINEETNKRETATVFHSPYKDGRPNKQYINPSFISSHLLYSQ